MYQFVRKLIIREPEFLKICYFKDLSIRFSRNDGFIVNSFGVEKTILSERVASVSSASSCLVIVYFISLQFQRNSKEN